MKTLKCCSPLIGMLLFLLSTSSPILAQKLSIYGDAHTPRGNLRVLIVYAALEGYETGPNVNGWDNSLMGDYELPNYVAIDGNGQITTHDFLFNQPEDFESGGPIDDVNNKSISKITNLMSKPNEDFRIYGDVFTTADGDPALIVVDPFEDPTTNTPYQYASQIQKSFSNLNKKVVQQMQVLRPDFDWSAYDQRTNNPGYLFERSFPEVSGPDGIIDYIVIIYRYGGKKEPSVILPQSANNSAPDTISIYNFFGAGGGYASLGSGGTITDNNGQQFFWGTGFTASRGAGLPTSLFIHELAHSLFDAPHIGSSNNVCGQYFYVPTVGWGATAHNRMFETYNAWERWYLGYISPMEPDENATYNVRDFVNTGDAIRVPIPFSGGQHLWIENHTGASKLDEHIWRNSEIGPGEIRVPNSSNGVYMYVENIADSQAKTGVVVSGANGIKLINANGNYDYKMNPDAPEVSNNWGGKVYQFDRRQANPIGGINPWLKHRDDYSTIPLEDLWQNPDVINIDANYNSAGDRNEGYGIGRELVGQEDLILYQSLGGNVTFRNGYNRNPSFMPGDELSMGTNPTILNHTKYNSNTKAFEPFYLNGLFVKINQMSGGVAEVEVKFKETLINNHVRWTGDIILPNITMDDAADLMLGADKKLTLDLSETANRHTRHPDLGGFVNPSKLTISSGAKLHLGERSNLTVKNHSTLIIEAGAEVFLDEGACIVIEPGGRLVMNNNEIHLNGANSVIIVKGELKTAANVDLTFTGPGYVVFYDTHILNLGANSNFVLTRDSNKSGKRFLRLMENTVLSINDRSLVLKYGNVEYKNNSSIEVTNTPVEALMVQFKPAEEFDVGATAIKSIVTDANFTALSKIEYCQFSFLNNGLHFENTSDFSVGTNLRLKSNTFEIIFHPLVCKSIPQINLKGDNFINNQHAIEVEFAANLILDQVTITETANDGVWLRGVNFANINRSTIAHSQFASGIKAQHSNVFVDAGTTIANNALYGVHFVNNEWANYALTVGGYGCANIINNETAGVFGDNIILHIDALEHAFNNGNPDEPLANRFDGNGPNGTGPIFEICYTDPTILPTDVIVMNGNYWGGEPLATYEYYLMYDGCDDPRFSSRLGVDAAIYVADLNLLTDCSLIMHIEPVDDPESPPSVICEIEVNEEVRIIQDEVQGAWQDLTVRDYIGAREKYLPVASLETGNGAYANACRNKVHFARCMVEAIPADIRNRFEAERKPIWESQQGKDLILVPNPASDQVQLMSNAEYPAAIVELRNALGLSIKRLAYTPGMRISLKDIEPGIYFLRTFDGKGKFLHLEKLVVL